MYSLCNCTYGTHVYVQVPVYSRVRTVGHTSNINFNIVVSVVAGHARLHSRIVTPSLVLYHDNPPPPMRSSYNY